MRALLVMLACTAAAAAPVPRVADAEVSETAIRAWRAAGAEVRWVAPSGSWDDKPTPGCRMGFRFHGWVPGRFDDLPAPEAPFHLDVSFPWPGDERMGVAEEITDAGVKELITFQNLRSLDVFGQGVTDAGAEHIAKLSGLEQLDLTGTKVTAAGLKVLAKIQSIKRLSLSQMDVTEGMLAEVAAFKGLTRFDLSFNKTEVTAAGMRRLAMLETLTKIGFFGVDVSDAAAIELGRCKALMDIDFLNTKVTPSGAAELRKRLPGCDTTVRTVDLSIPPPSIP